VSRRLTHRDERRQAVTVDVGCKPATLCAAVGWGFVSTAPEAHRPAGSGRLPKEGPLADASLKREKPTACAVTCLPLCDRVPNSAIEGFFLRRRRRHSAEKLYLLKGEGLLFRVPLAEPDGTLGLPFGSFAFRWRSQRERSVCHSGLSRFAGEARGSARVAFPAPPRSKGLARGASPRPWPIPPPDPVRGRMPPIPWQVMVQV